MEKIMDGKTKKKIFPITAILIVFAVMAASVFICQLGTQSENPAEQTNITRDQLAYQVEDLTKKITAAEELLHKACINAGGTEAIWDYDCEEYLCCVKADDEGNCKMVQFAEQTLHLDNILLE